MITTHTHGARDGVAYFYGETKPTLYLFPLRSKSIKNLIRFPHQTLSTSHNIEVFGDKTLFQISTCNRSLTISIYHARTSSLIMTNLPVALKIGCHDTILRCGIRHEMVNNDGSEGFIMWYDSILEVVVLISKVTVIRDGTETEALPIEQKTTLTMSDHNNLFLFQFSSTGSYPRLLFAPLPRRVVVGVYESARRLAGGVDERENRSRAFLLLNGRARLFSLFHGREQFISISGAVLYLPLVAFLAAEFIHS